MHFFVPLVTAFLVRTTPRRLLTHGSSSSLSAEPPSRIPIGPPVVADNPAKYDDLLSWLRDCATVNDKVTLAESKCGGGFGAFVQDAVEKDEVLFEIPRSLCMTVEDALGDVELGEPMAKLIEKAGPGANTVALAGFIAKERLMGDDSLYAPYLETLPWERFVNSQEHILYWTDEQVEQLLKDSMGYDEVLGLRKEVDLAISVLGNVLTNRPTSPSGFVLPWQKNADGDEPVQPRDGLPQAVVGSFVCLLTRAFQDGVDEDDDDEKLVPLLDMLQHSDAPNVRHTMSKDTGDVQVRARFALEAQTELLNQYRSEMEESMPYHRFFTRFGFVPGLQDQPVVNLLLERSSIFFAQKAEV